MHSGIQPCNSNAQISINNLLIPRYNEDSDGICYEAIHCYVKASDLDCVSTDIFVDEASFRLIFP